MLREARVNDGIRARKVRLIDENGRQIGILDIEDARERAREAGLDLVEVASGIDPPVCKIMNYGKYKYEQHKKAKASKKKQRVIVVKEVKMRPRIEEHDYQFKARHIQEFLEDGNKVKVRMVFRGRELFYKDLAQKVLDRLIEEMSPISIVENSPKLHGKDMILILAPKK